MLGHKNMMKFDYMLPTSYDRDYDDVDDIRNTCVGMKYL